MCPCDSKQPTVLILLREHLGIALALNVPVMVVITKIDICPPQILQQTITQLTKILKSPGARKIPIFIKNREDCINTAVGGSPSGNGYLLTEA